MKEIVKSKTKKYYYEETKIYKCETCGAEYEHSYKIDRCEVCGKDICPNCNCVDIVQFKGSMYLQNIYNGKTLQLTREYDPSDYDMRYLYSKMMERPDRPIPKLTIHKECANQRLTPEEYFTELCSIIQYFNDSIKWLNNKTFNEHKVEDQTKFDEYRQTINLYEKKLFDYEKTLSEYQQELDSDTYKIFKNLNDKQKQMLKLID